VENPALVGSGICHVFISLVLFRVDVVQESLAMCRLFVKLDEVTTSTAVGLCHILKATALKVVLFADGSALHARKDTVQTRYTEKETLEERVVSQHGLHL
jgi:hypothetical protein